MFINLLKNTYSYIFSIITPPFCYECSMFLDQETILCDDCWRSVQPVAPTIISLTLQKSIVVHALGTYAFPLKKFILAKNYTHIAASNLLGHALWDRTHISTIHFDYVVPIPLHWTRRCWRGFNQAEEIGNVIAKSAGKKLVHALSRHKRTLFQAQCNKQQRIHNVNNAFTLAIDKELIKNKTILLVDDLLTTGATIAHAARLLYKAGAKEVIGVVGCKAV